MIPLGVLAPRIVEAIAESHQPADGNKELLRNQHPSVARVSTVSKAFTQPACGILLRVSAIAGRRTEWWSGVDSNPGAAKASLGGIRPSSGTITPK
jgi:hypothetical protein